jgi:Uma2 family endonuclease
MTWQEVVEHPSLRDLPFKIELNEWGQIVMSPTKVLHAAYQSKIDRLLYSLMKRGRPWSSARLRRERGPRWPTSCGASPARYKRIKREIACSTAPEICVEVFSESNTKAEMDEKRQLYFERGRRKCGFAIATARSASTTPRAS